MAGVGKQQLRVFGIGLNKTGTSSLAQALEILGFKVLHNDYVAREAIKRERKEGLQLLSTLEKYNAFLDVPFDTLWQELDACYPGSKFILTKRDVISWLKSRERHVRFNRMNAAYRGLWLQIDKLNWGKEWQEHHDKVHDYFKDRRQDLLIMDICEGEGWEKLCTFLDMQVPSCAFPQANVAKGKQATLFTPFIIIFQVARVSYHLAKFKTLRLIKGDFCK